MRRILLALAILTASAYPLMTAYKVEPVKASWSGMADPRPDYGISQTITCNWDHLDSATGAYVELFAGGKGAGGLYNLDIRDSKTEERIAYKHGVAQGQDHTWVRFDTLVIEGSFVKGRQYEFKWCRQTDRPPLPQPLLT